MMTTARRDDPPIGDAPSTEPALTATVTRLKSELAAARAEIRRRDAADLVEWAPLKAVADLTNTPYPTLHRWKTNNVVTWRTAVDGRVEIFLASVRERIRRLGRGYR